MMPPASFLSFVGLSVVTMAPLAAADPTDDILPPTDCTPPVELGGDPDDWTFNVAPYGWFTGASGVSEIAGESSAFNFGFSEFYDALDSGGMLLLHGQRGRIGFTVDGFFGKLSGDIDQESQIFSHVGLGINQALLAGAVSYRVAESDRGFFDVFAGVRWFYIGFDVDLQQNSQGISNLSQDISRDVFDRTAAVVRPALERAGDEISSAIRSEIDRQIEDNVRAPIRDRIQEVLDGLPDGGANIPPDGPIRQRLRELAAAASAEIEAAAAEVRGEIRAKVTQKLRKARVKAERDLAKALEKKVKKSIPKEVSGSQQWLDPVIGFRAQYNINKKWYLSAKADVGGFGIGSEQSWEMMGALGYHLNDRWTVAGGYRHLFMDYQNGDFKFENNLSGPFLGVAYSF